MYGQELPLQYANYDTNQVMADEQPGLPQEEKKSSEDLSNQLIAQITQMQPVNTASVAWPNMEQEAQQMNTRPEQNSEQRIASNDVTLQDGSGYFPHMHNRQN